MEYNTTKSQHNTTQQNTRDLQCIYNITQYNNTNTIQHNTIQRITIPVAYNPNTSQDNPIHYTWNTIKSNTIPCNTTTVKAQYNTNYNASSTQYITIAHNIIAGNTKQYIAHTINAIQCKSIHINATQYKPNAIQMQHNTTQHNTTQHNTMQYNTIQYNTTQHITHTI